MAPGFDGRRVLNVALATLVVAIGFSFLWGTAFLPGLAAWTAAVAGFLWWKATSTTEIWAWSTLLLGAESFAWPVVLMVQLKHAAVTPSDEDMGTIATGIVLGLFSSVFWVSFAYGLFKRAWGIEVASRDAALPPAGTSRRVENRQKKR